MKFRVLNQGIGVVVSPLPEIVEKTIAVEIEEAEGEVVKLVGEDHVAYKKIENGSAVFDRAELHGRIGLSLVRASGSVQLGGFVCANTDKGMKLYHDAEALLSRLAKVEGDISDVIAENRALAAKYDDLTKKIEQLFTGYSF